MFQKDKINTMKRNNIVIIVCLILVLASCDRSAKDYRNLTPDVLKDKIAGGWAGKMIGVTYGAPTEFRAESKTYEDSIRWVPQDIQGSIWQDDLYVQLTFLMTMDRFGADAPAKKYQELFARAGYPLWHANVQARKNYFDSIFPPASGSPKYNFHADDIDFQIEADYIGFMCPGMPQQAVKLCDKIGHIMNYGDGLYGGIFVAALYAEAFFETDIEKIIENALLSIPAESDYVRIVRDVILLHKHYPDDWRVAWKELEAKWGDVDVCGAGSAFNIDAKLNGAYIVMGLLYGDGDPVKTMEVSTRCGQDSDCNPSNAMAVLGVIRGFSNLPAEMKDGINAIKDSVFINTDYTFNKAVENTYTYALDFIVKGGGEVTDNAIKIKKQIPVPPALEVAFPDLVFCHKASIFEDKAWKFKGRWLTFKSIPWGGGVPVEQSKFAGKKGDEVEFAFNGTGVTLMGNWVKDGGKADIYLDGELNQTIDSYFFWSGQEHHSINLWHVFGLQPGDHTVRVVVKGEKRPESLGTSLYLTEALVFRTERKKNDLVRFSFEK
jgi:hypothetical protein